MHSSESITQAKYTYFDFLILSFLYLLISNLLIVRLIIVIIFYSSFYFHYYYYQNSENKQMMVELLLLFLVMNFFCVLSLLISSRTKHTFLMINRCPYKMILLLLIDQCYLFIFLSPKR